MDRFPKWKYAADGRALIVDDAESEEALGDGWYDSPAEVPDPSDDPAKEDAATLEALKAEAETLGIKVDARWGEKRLTKEIAAAKEA